MNSVIQQLYMIPPIRNGILAIEGTGTDVDDDMSGDEKQENEVPRYTEETNCYPSNNIQVCRFNLLVKDSVQSIFNLL